MEDFDRLTRLEALVESNARAIEAISANTAEYQRDRARMYELMADLAQAQADGKREMYRMLGDLDQRQGQLSQRQGEIVEILKLLVKPQKDAETD